MTYEATLTDVREPGPDSGRAVERVFVTVHLLTADVARAESAVLAAIDEWDPDYEPEEALFDRALAHALQTGSGDALSSPEIARRGEAAVPAEFQAVLALPAALRRCFVLRILRGLSRGDCAGLLNITVSNVDANTCRALMSLPRRSLLPRL